MHRLTKDDLVFKGQDEVLKRLETDKLSIKSRILLILNYELEIPLAGLAVTCVFCVALLGFQFKKNAVVLPEYPIVVIQRGGTYEVY